MGGVPLARYPSVLVLPTVLVLPSEESTFEMTLPDAPNSRLQRYRLTMGAGEATGELPRKLQVKLQVKSSACCVPWRARCLDGKSSPRSASKVKITSEKHI
jgi:hypothetical protein